MPVTVESEQFRLRFLPEQGGKVDEIYAHHLRRNLLLPLHPAAALPLPDGAVFSVNGWDECLPTVAASAGAPDLGHAWRTAPEYGLAGSRLFTRWTVPGWQLERAVNLRANGLAAHYVMTNVDAAPAPLLWAAHVLLPLAGMQEVMLPGGNLLPGPGCDVEALARERLSGDAHGWQIRDIRRRKMSWKFFLPADRPVVLHYADTTLTMTTDAGWWGVWLNEGNFCDLLCIGVEPTTAPSDLLADSRLILEPGEFTTATWEMSLR